MRGVRRGGRWRRGRGRGRGGSVRKMRLRSAARGGHNVGALDSDSDLDEEWRPSGSRRNGGYASDAVSSLFPRSPSMQSLRVRPRRLDLERPLVLLGPEESEQMCAEEALYGRDFSLAPEDFAEMTAEGASFETDVSRGTQEYDVITQQPKRVVFRDDQASEIHVPTFRHVVETSGRAFGFRQPSHYVRYNQRRVVSAAGAEYEMDSEDEQFLFEFNSGRRVLNEDRFEQLVDLLEAEAGRLRAEFDLNNYRALKRFRMDLDRIHILLDVVARREKVKKELETMMAKEGEGQLVEVKEELMKAKVSSWLTERSRRGVCRVCFKAGDGTTATAVQLCGQCGLTIHTSCYGPGRRKGNIWLCDWCAKKKTQSGDASCVLCPCGMGAVKKTSDGQWCHATCALFTPGVMISAPSEPECGYDIDISGIRPERLKGALPCMICRKKSGARIYCDDPTCTRAFHVMCAVFAGFYLEVLPDHQPPVPCPRVERRGRPELKQFNAFCKFHIPVSLQLLDESEGVLGGTPVFVSHASPSAPSPSTWSLVRAVDVRQKHEEEEFVDIESVDEPTKSRAVSPPAGGTGSLPWRRLEMPEERMFDPLRRLFLQLPLVAATPTVISAAPNSNAGATGPGAIPKSPSKIRFVGTDLPRGGEEFAICAVCHNGESWTCDAIVFCDGCNISVHQSCYGVPFVPPGNWYCDRCREGAPRVSCALCPIKSGAFKRAKSGQWVHVLCALWMPGVSFGNPDLMQDIVGLESVDSARFKLMCYICRKRGGACIQCRIRSCTASFHPSCCQRSSSGFMKLVETADGKVLHLAYCKEHRDFGMKQAFQYEAEAGQVRLRIRHTPRLAALGAPDKGEHSQITLPGPPLPLPDIVVGRQPSVPNGQANGTALVQPGRIVSVSSQRLPPVSPPKTPASVSAAAAMIPPSWMTSLSPSRPLPSLRQPIGGNTGRLLGPNGGGPVPSRALGGSSGMALPHRISQGPGLSHFSPPLPRRIGGEVVATVGGGNGSTLALSSRGKGKDTRAVSPRDRQRAWDEAHLLGMAIDSVSKGLVWLQSEIFDRVHSHWLKKRLRLGKPLLDRYQGSPFAGLEIFQPFDPVDHPAFCSEVHA